MNFQILNGDALAMLKTMPSESVQCVVTSPPYWGLRDYGVAGQIGLERTLAEWLKQMTAVFAEVRRVLRSNGTCWVNMGDCYAHAGICGGGSPVDSRKLEYGRRGSDGDKSHGRKSAQAAQRAGKIPDGLKQKDLVGQPWRLAFALQDSGWYLRADIIWHKPNPMPESVRDRPTKSHEYLFLLSKSERYFYDRDATREPVTGNAHKRGKGVNAKVAGWQDGPGSHSAKDFARAAQGLKDSTKFGRGAGWRNNGVGFGHGFDAVPKPRVKQNPSFSAAVKDLVEKRNRRSVWTIATQAFKGAHFATFPEKLVLPCLLAGTRAGDTVLDPFAGAATVGLVALKLGRRFVGIELNPAYVKMANDRIRSQLGLLVGADL